MKRSWNYTNNQGIPGEGSDGKPEQQKWEKLSCVKPHLLLTSGELAVIGENTASMLHHHGFFLILFGSLYPTAKHTHTCSKKQQSLEKAGTRKEEGGKKIRLTPLSPI